MDRGRVVGFFESSDPRALDDLVARARRLATAKLGTGLPTVNASLNALCAVFLIAGWMAIRRRRTPLADPLSHVGGESRRTVSLLDQPEVRTHLVFMLLAVATSSIFLACYLVYHYQAGSMPFRHPGLVRWPISQSCCHILFWRRSALCHW